MADFIVWLGSTLVLFSIIFFMFGCIVGSFLNVVIHRLPREMSVANPPSHCPQCGYTIPWYQNLPLITWLWQRGRCAGCDTPIPIRYFLVELLTGLAFLGAWLLVHYHFAAGAEDPFLKQPIVAALVTLALVTLLVVLTGCRDEQAETRERSRDFAGTLREGRPEALNPYGLYRQTKAGTFEAVTAATAAGSNALPELGRCASINNFWCLKTPGGAQWKGQIGADASGHAVFVDPVSRPGPSPG